MEKTRLGVRRLACHSEGPPAFSQQTAVVNKEAARRPTNTPLTPRKMVAMNSAEGISGLYSEIRMEWILV